ncbi:MAG TPA: molybdenum cofactor guanylyltransferase [Gaiellales bacterium]
MLAGGGSRRMGAAKATLDWHGAPLVRRVAGLLGRVAGTVVVVGAPGQELPPMPGVLLAVDETPGRGPLEGIAAGLRTLDGRCAAIFVAATDLPFLHPAFVLAVADALGGSGAAVPELAGRLHPLAGAYGASALPLVDRLLAGGERRATALPEHADTAVLAAEGLPHPESLRNVNSRRDYEEALREPEPAVRVDGTVYRAATLGRLLHRVQLAPGSALALGGARLGDDLGFPLADGDELSAVPAGQVPARRPSST